MSACNVSNTFFLLNCLTSFEIGWVTTNMRINEKLAKEKKYHYIIRFERHLNTSDLFMLQKARTDVFFDFQKHHIGAQTALLFKLQSTISM